MCVCHDIGYFLVGLILGDVLGLFGYFDRLDVFGCVVVELVFSQFVYSLF